MKLYEKFYNVRFMGDLRAVEVEQDPTYWVMLEPYFILWEDDNGTTRTLRIPQWYVTDWASTGPAKHIVHPMDIDIRKGAGGHDRAYETHELTQRQADALLYYAMLARGARYYRAWLVWAAVRAFGHLSYVSGPKRREHRQSLAVPYIKKRRTT